MMDIEKLIEQYMQAADKWEKRHPVTDTFDLRVQDALRDAATALSTLKAENEKLRETVDKYATAARVIALHLKPFCDESLPYDEMIADAARKASDELEQVKRENNALWTYIEIVDREYRRYMDRGYIDRLDELRRTWKYGQKEGLTMKRLTWQNYDMCQFCGEGTCCEHYCDNTFPVCDDKAIYDRLAAYEDTGLEPEEIIELKGGMEGLEK